MFPVINTLAKNKTEDHVMNNKQGNKSDKVTIMFTATVHQTFGCDINKNISLIFIVWIIELH